MGLKKNIEIENKFKEGVEAFTEDVFLSETVEELREIMNKIIDITFKYASKKNNRPNKGLKIMAKYGELQDNRENKIKKAIRRKKAKTYMDYLPKFEKMYNQGYSYRELQDYAYKSLNITVSRETIRVKLIKYREQNNV